MKILSLFDGMSCGMIAFKELGIDVENYDAYEIDDYAIKVSKHNFPEIKQCGDIFKGDFTQYKSKVDWIVGGSPCTHWSIAQTKNRETTASGIGWELFSQYVRAVKEAEPKYFLYENNKSMSKEIRASITETFGFEPILINSALVSAQNRQRLYWVGIRNEDGAYRKADIEQPDDRGIILKDILERHQQSMVAEPVNITEDGKSHTLKAQYYKDGMANFITNDGFNTTGVAEPICVAQRGKNPENPKSRVAGLPTEQMFEAREDEKTNTLTTVQKDNLVAEPIDISECDVTTTENYLQYDINHKGNKSQDQRAYYPENKHSTLMSSSTQSKTGVIEPINHSIQVGALPRPNGELSTSQAFRIYSIEGKSVTINGNGGGAGGKTGLYAIQIDEKGKEKEIPIYEVKDGQITVKGKQYPIKLKDGYYIIRKLTVKECMRLQTVPEWYDFSCISNSRAYKCLGNGWTVEVIKHLIKSAMKDGGIHD